MWNNSTLAKSNQAGFSLLEMIVAIFLLTIGLIGTVAAITYVLQMTTASRNIGSAKLIIISTFEEIEALRNDGKIEFRQIANVGEVDNTDVRILFSGYSKGLKPISLSPGPDFINGTDDDLMNAGEDKEFGTKDDFEDESLIRSGYQREIIISSIPNQLALKKVEVKIRYFSVGGSVQEVSGISYINDSFRVVSH